MIEFDGLAVTISQAPGVRSSTLGSSGMVDRYSYSFSLNSSTETLVMFLRVWGRHSPFCLLTHLGPFKEGILSSLPLLLLMLGVSPQFGTKFSRIFKVYIIRCLSNFLF